MSGKRIGEVTYFDDRLGKAVIILSHPLAKGDTVHFLGHGSDFSQQISSIQIEQETVITAKSGDEITIKTIKPVRVLTSVYLLTEE